MNSAEIGSLVEKTKQCNPTALGRPSFRYIDIASIDRQNKGIIAAQIIPSDKAPSRARKVIASGDVLISTVRPNLNAVALVSKQYDSEIASTGFCILRPNKVLLDSVYLFYFVQTERFVSNLIQLATGAGYPAVSDADILETEIPLPTLVEQKRIAALLDKVDRLRRTRRYVQQLGDSFLQSVFLEMFGDPVTNPYGWEKVELADLVEAFEGGVNFNPVPENGPTSSWRVLKISSVTSGEFKPHESKAIAPDTTFNESLCAASALV